MKKFNDFNLDVNNSKVDKQNVNPVVSYIASEVFWSVVQGCTPDCLTTKCTEECTIACNTEYTDECASI